MDLESNLRKLKHILDIRYFICYSDMYIQLIIKRIKKQCFNRIPSPQGLICHFILKHSCLELVQQTNYILTQGFKIIIIITIIYINIQ